jgi:hypothetical protein
MSTRVAALARLVLLAGPAALAFASGGYFEGPRLVAAIAAWALLAVLLLAARGPLPRGAAFGWAAGGLAALTGWALLSRTWAPLAGPAGEDAQRDALYLAALAAGTLAWRPREWARAVEPALAAGVLIVIGYALAGRLLPGVVPEHHAFTAGGRLDQPLTYWNATGALAAIGFVLCARLAGDAGRRPALRALAAGGSVPLGLAVYLTYSRGALAALGCGLVALGLLAPTWAQLRAGALCVQAGVYVAALVTAFDGVASLHGSTAHREGQGAAMLAVLLALTLAATALQAHGCRVEAAGRIRTGPLPLGPRTRLAVVVATLALAAVPYVAAVARERGAPAPAPAFGATPQRLGSIGSNRYAYWRVAVRTFAHHPLRGTGAASFRVAWLRERTFPETVRDAHSLYLETAAELGLAGLAALLAMLAGVAGAARRTWRRDPGLAAGPAAALAVWAVHAGVDWDWEMPALSLVAVTLAGVLLARAAARPS